MKPQSPVLPRLKEFEIIIAKDQDPYIPLPTLRVDDSCVLTRWHMTWFERLVCLIKGDVYLWIKKDIHTQLQPVMLQVRKP